ncbi:MAG: hypothetical protein QXU01_00490 [Candidatus Hadarchaeales archaeon]
MKKAGIIAGSLLLLFLGSALVSATDQIKAGGTYTVHVTLRKPPGMSLDKGTWEVRAYFYSGTNCFNVGEWWQPTGSTEYLYTGWWTPRYPPNGAKYSEAWVSPDEKSITALVIQVLSENTQIDNYVMRPPVEGESVTLRVRLRLKNMTFERKDNYVEFKMGGKTYRPEVERQVGNTVYLKGGGKLDVTTNELDIDVDTPVVVSATAPATGSFSATVDIPDWPTVAAAPMSNLPIIAGAAVIIICIAVAAALLRKKKPAQA